MIDQDYVLTSEEQLAFRNILKDSGMLITREEAEQIRSEQPKYIFLKRNRRISNYHIFLAQQNALLNAESKLLEVVASIKKVRRVLYA